MRLATHLDPQAARLLFQRTLASWAGDLLALRRRGLLRPAWGPDGFSGGGVDWSEAA